MPVCFHIMEFLSQVAILPDSMSSYESVLLPLIQKKITR